MIQPIKKLLQISIFQSTHQLAVMIQQKSQIIWLDLSNICVRLFASYRKGHFKAYKYLNNFINLENHVNQNMMFFCNIWVVFYIIYCETMGFVTKTKWIAHQTNSKTNPKYFWIIFLHLIICHSLFNIAYKNEKLFSIPFNILIILNPFGHLQ